MEAPLKPVVVSMRQPELTVRRDPYPRGAAEGFPQWPPQVPPPASCAAVGLAVHCYGAVKPVGQKVAVGEPRVVAPGPAESLRPA